LEPQSQCSHARPIACPLPFSSASSSVARWGENPYSPFQRALAAGVQHRLGTDVSDDYGHIAANISPSVYGTAPVFFFTDEIAAIVAPESGGVLWETDGTPNVR
jgi:hypothetical protein